jgi:uncharacterized membrane protein
MLIVFPLGLLATSFVFDIIYLIISDGRTVAAASFYMIAAGVLGGLAAALVGLLDWMAIPPGTRARQIGAVHGIGNLLVVVLFIVSWALRLAVGYQDPGVGPIVLSFLGVCIALVTGWLGGELVYRLNVGPETGANLDAPSSLAHDAREGLAPKTQPGLQPAESQRPSFPGR